ncbi:MAG TPA: hypothetical protein DEH75_00855, partial [Bradyrhizobium sp.]|nr:hypothetical protein [Bradyrhizobium sp.]
AVSGAQMKAALDGVEIAYHEPIAVRAGQTLAIGSIKGPGQRSYLAVRGGFNVPQILGSRAVFALGA